MKVLVTGHEGFIGKHLVRELEQHAHAVAGHDRAQGRLETRVGLNALIGRINSFKPAWLVHLAGHVGRLNGELDPWHTVMSNAAVTAVVAKVAAASSVPVLYASSSEAYGDQSGRVCYEEGPTVLPHNLYGLSKRWGEEAMMLYAPRRLRIARLSMPYGPGAPPGRGRRALDNFLWQAHHRMPIPVHKGSERSWCHISDTVRGLRLILERGDAHLYNVGRDDRPVPMLNVARTCCLLADAPLDLIRLVDAPAGQTVVKRLSTTRLRRLGWSPTVELAEGLPELYEWVKTFDRNGEKIVA